MIPKQKKEVSHVEPYDKNANEEEDIAKEATQDQAQDGTQHLESKICCIQYVS